MECNRDHKHSRIAVSISPPLARRLPLRGEQLVPRHEGHDDQRQVTEVRDQTAYLPLLRVTRAVAVDVQNLPHGPHGAAPRRGDWEHQTVRRGHHHHRRHPLQGLLVRTLHAVERLGVFVAGFRVKRRVLHVELLAREGNLRDAKRCNAMQSWRQHIHFCVLWWRRVDDWCDTSCSDSGGRGSAYLDAAVHGGHHRTAEGDEGPAVFTGELHACHLRCEGGHARLGVTQVRTEEGSRRNRHAIFSAGTRRSRNRNESLRHTTARFRSTRTVLAALAVLGLGPLTGLTSPRSSSSR